MLVLRLLVRNIAGIQSVPAILSVSGQLTPVNKLELPSTVWWDYVVRIFACCPHFCFGIDIHCSYHIIEL